MRNQELTRILVGVDLDDSSAAALRTAETIGRRFDAHITVVHAHQFERPAYFTGAQMGALKDERDEARARCTADVAAFAAAHLHTPFTSVVEDGAPADVIGRLAPAYDLIIVGTRRRRGPQRWWLGSVAEAVLRHVTVPVLVVPTELSSATDEVAHERKSS